MIFAPDMVALVLDGSKTVTRRISNDGLCVCRYQPGRTYSVQPGRGQPAVGRIRVTQEPRLEHVTAITEDDAAREGFASVAAFRERWIAMHGAWEQWIDVGLGRVDMSALVWRIEFDLVGGAS